MRGANREQVETSRVVALAVVALAVLAALPASASERAASFDDDGVLVEPGAEEVDREALAEAVATARADGVALSVGLLAEDPSGGAEAEAGRLVNALGGTVLLLTPAEVAAVSDDHDDARIDAALDAAGDDFADGGDVVAGVHTFAAALHGSGGNDSAFSTSNLPGPLADMDTQTLVIGGIILLVLVFRVLPRLFGFGRRGRYRGAGRYGRRRRRGGLAGGVLGGAAAGTIAGRSRRGGSRSSSSRSRGSSSRSRGSSSRSRGGGSRRR